MSAGKLLQRARLQRTQVQQTAPDTSPRLAQRVRAALIDLHLSKWECFDQNPNKIHFNPLFSIHQLQLASKLAELNQLAWE